MAMIALKTKLPGLLILEPKVFSDDRGFFFESCNLREFRELTGADVDFVQDNHAHSKRGVLRGLHYQIEHAQGKLVRAVHGTIIDVAVDLRRSSPTFGQWEAVELSSENRRQIWVPGGFAHGYLVVSDSSDVLYKTTDYWFPQFERCIRWNDPTLGVSWPDPAPIVSAKDHQGSSLEAAEVYP